MNGVDMLPSVPLRAFVSAIALLGLVLVGCLVGQAWVPGGFRREIADSPVGAGTLRSRLPRAGAASEEQAGAGKVLDSSAASAASPVPQLDRFDEPGTLPGEALLTFRTARGLAAFEKRADGLGVTILGAEAKLRTVRVRFADPGFLARDLAAHAQDYERAGPNHIARIPGLPIEDAGRETSTDTANAGGRAPFQSQGLEFIGAAGDRSQWGKGITVAVVDSGIGSHPSLSRLEIRHVDLLRDGGEMNGHGTAMATLIAGSDAQVGGVAPAARLLDIRVADREGVSSTALLASGIVRAVDLGARVINVSLGTEARSPVLMEAIRYAQDRNILIVAAAGNEQQTALAYPAALPGVLSVGAVDASGKQAWFSNSGTGLTLVAPGVGIVSGYSGGRLVIGSGTSQATALTSGAVASLMSRGYSASSIIPLLMRSARPLGAPRRAVGAGLLHLPQSRGAGSSGTMPR